MKNNTDTDKSLLRELKKIRDTSDFVNGVMNVVVSTKERQELLDFIHNFPDKANHDGVAAYAVGLVNRRKSK